MLHQLIDHTHQNISQQAHGYKEEGHIGFAGNVVEHGIGHDGQNQNDGSNYFRNRTHG